MIETIDIPPRPTWMKRKPTRTTEAAERAAHKFGVCPAKVLELMPEALAMLRQQQDGIESARKRARQLTGLDARIIASRENRYLDHSTDDGFDAAARDVASECPQLGLDPHGHDTPAMIWDFIRAGSQPLPVRHSDCVAELAAEWAYRAEVGEYPDDAGDATFDPSQWEDVATPPETSETPRLTYPKDAEQCLSPISSQFQTPTLAAALRSSEQANNSQVASLRANTMSATNATLHSRTLAECEQAAPFQSSTLPLLKCGLSELRSHHGYSTPTLRQCHATPSESHDPAYVAGLLLAKAAQFCEYGEGYCRNIAESANRLRSIIASGHSDSMISQASDELSLRLRVHGNTTTPACVIQHEGRNYAAHNPCSARRVPLRTSRPIPPRRDNLARAKTGWRSRPVTMWEVRPVVADSSVLVAPSACGSTGQPRLNRVKPSHPVYVAGRVGNNALPRLKSRFDASCRSRDGPRVCHPVSVV